MTLSKYCIFPLTILCTYTGYSQINSPYSRYGLGDLYNGRNVLNKGMGNLATPVYDVQYQSVNFLNPASYSRLQTVSFDVGVEFENRKLTGIGDADTYKSNNLAFNYVALGIPLLRGKDGLSRWGLALGLRPMTRTNYNITQNERLPGIDSIGTIYNGSGGASKAYAGTGFRIGGFAIGANLGVLFGQQKISTQRIFYNDSIQYYSSNHQTQVAYSMVYADGGLQWDIKLNKRSVVRLAATAFIGGDARAKSDYLRETISYNGSSSFDSVDVAIRENNVKGTITLPGGYTAGLAFEKLGVWMIGAEYETVNWNKYRYYNKTDQVGSTNMFRVGGQWVPSVNTRRYINRISYRVGFYTGQDYVKVNNKQLPIWAATFGFGFPIRRYSNYSNQFTLINTSFEIGKRGSGIQPVTENFFRLNVGLSLGDLWFIKRKFE